MDVPTPGDLPVKGDFRTRPEAVAELGRVEVGPEVQGSEVVRAFFGSALGVASNELRHGDVEVHAGIDELVSQPVARPVVGQVGPLEDSPVDRVLVAVEFVVAPVDVDDGGGLFEEGGGLDFFRGGLRLVFRVCIHIL